MTAPLPVEEKLRQLIELRKKEEEEYGKLLTQLDQICKFPLPEENSANFLQVKDALNQIWDISKQSFAASAAEDRTFWKEVARSFEMYLQPTVNQQREVNSVLVHLLNEYIQAVHSSLQQIREFQCTLILYFQKIVPVIDTKFREMAGVAESFQVGLRDYMDLLYQELDKKIETLQLDVQEKLASKNKLWCTEDTIANQPDNSVAGVVCIKFLDGSKPEESIQFLKTAKDKLSIEGILMIQAQSSVEPQTVQSLLKATGFRDIQILRFPGREYAVLAFK